MSLISISAFCIIMLIIFKDDILGTYRDKLEWVEDDEPIDFPAVPMPNQVYMEDNFFNIMFELAFCVDETELESVYSSIIAFECYYPNSAKYTSLLVEGFYYKQRILKPVISLNTGFS